MVYLDHNATTPLDGRVLEAMRPYLQAFYGNPSGLYKLGRLSRSAIDTARQQVAALVGADPAEVIFTSGGTEANNLALKGLAFGLPHGLAVAGATEHPSVSEPLRFLEQLGWRVATLPVDRDGQPDTADLDSLPFDSFRFASLMLANNETGVIHAIGPLAAWVAERGGFLHCDAVQAAGKIPLDFKRSGAHLLSLSAHKLYGPKGVGALVVDRSVPLEPLLHGGGQERDQRGGTENVAAIVGFGQAAELALAELEARSALLLRLRQYLEAGLRELPGIKIFAERAARLPNTVQFALEGLDGETLVMNLDRQGIAVSSGSACASGGGEPSPVLTAMGIPADLAKGAIRASLGQDNTEADIERFLAVLRSLACTLRG
ncbi:cysteine desulfurase family protein [Methylomagnum ishizawai]|uniref:cysteine desulfurase family protein n=1 Tax=Methylomagnum ishizawai TaxID=1760988 RepID=UPI001C330C7B|nr:cysteine desulfurase family protein [Methylomagnum ishizawai]BBL73259.1 cysteine desulfurase [Methylomagnum ishizawai]